MSAKKFGKYRSRRKAKRRKGGGLVGDIGSGLNAVGKFVETSGKKVTDVAQVVAGAGGKVVSLIGDQIKDKKVKKAFKDVGNFSSKTGKDAMKILGKATPYIGKAGQWVGDKMMKSDSDYGGGFFGGMSFKHNDHAHDILHHFNKHDFHAMQSGARFVTGSKSKNDMHIMHHRPIRTAAMKHFHTIAGSTPNTLLTSLKQDKSGDLHKAITTSVHSAHLAGGHEFNEHRHTNVGGGFWDQVGKKIGSSAVLAGKIGLAASPVVSLIAPEFGVPLAAVSGATAGIGAAINEGYGVKTKLI